MEGQQELIDGVLELFSYFGRATVRRGQDPKGIGRHHGVVVPPNAISLR
jgi:hypothetical protein